MEFPPGGPVPPAPPVPPMPPPVIPPLPPPEPFRFDRGRRPLPWFKLVLGGIAAALAVYAYAALVHVEAPPDEASKPSRQAAVKGNIPELPPQKPVAKKPRAPEGGTAKADNKAAKPEGKRSGIPGSGTNAEFPFYDDKGRLAGILRARHFELRNLAEQDGLSYLQWPEIVLFNVDASSGIGLSDTRPDSEKSNVTARAHRGTFTRKDGTATLEESVELRDATGVLHTDRLRVNLKTRIMETDADEPVHIVEPGASIDGRGLWVSRAEGVMEVRKEVKASFEEGAAAEGEKDKPKEKAKEKEAKPAPQDGDAGSATAAALESLRASCDGTLRIEQPPPPDPKASPAAARPPSTMRFRKNVQILLRRKDDIAPTYLSGDDITLWFRRRAQASDEGKGAGSEGGRLVPTRLQSIMGPGQPVVLRRGGVDRQAGFEAVGGRFVWDFEKEEGEMSPGKGGDVVVRQGRNEMEGSRLTFARKANETTVELAGPIRGKLWKPPSAPPAPDKAAPEPGKAAPPPPKAPPEEEPFARYREAQEGKVSCEKFTMRLRAPDKGADRPPDGGATQPPKTPSPAGTEKLEEMAFTGNARVSLGPAFAQGREIRYHARTRLVTIESEGPGRPARLEDVDNALSGDRIQYEMTDAPQLVATGSAKGRFRGTPGSAAPAVRLVPGGQPFEVAADRIAIDWDALLRRFQGVDAQGKVEIFSEGMRGAGERLRWKAADLLLDFVGTPAQILSREGSISGRHIRHDDRRKVFVAEDGMLLKVLDSAAGAQALGLSTTRREPAAPATGGNGFSLRGDRLEVEFETDENAVAIEIPAGRMRRAVANGHLYLENPRGKVWGDRLVWDARKSFATIDGKDTRVEISSSSPIVLRTESFDVETPKPTPAATKEKKQPQNP